MKKIHHVCLAAIMAVSVGAPALAGNVTGLTTFTAGTPAKAAEVNGNFDAVKTAVDNNNARLTAVETDKQNRVTGACAVGSAVTAIAADGTVTCASLSAGNASGAASMSSVNFFVQNVANTSCQFIHSGSHGYMYGSTVGNCVVDAPVFLPHGVTLNSLTCTVFDNTGDAAGITQTSLGRAFVTDPVNAGGASQVLAIGATSDSASNQAISASRGGSTSSLYVVDNSQYAYSVQIWFNSGTSNFTTIGSNIKLFGCAVSYQP